MFCDHISDFAAVLTTRNQANREWKARTILGVQQTLEETEVDGQKHGGEFAFPRREHDLVQEDDRTVPATWEPLL
jgi:hypothetical protein